MIRLGALKEPNSIGSNKLGTRFPQLKVGYCMGRRCGHDGQTNPDRAIGFRVLMERVATRHWRETSIPALNRLGAEINGTSSISLRR
jgi:hypothetical protein